MLPEFLGVIWCLIFVFTFRGPSGSVRASDSSNPFLVFLILTHPISSTSSSMRNDDVFSRLPSARTSPSELELALGKTLPVVPAAGELKTVRGILGGASFDLLSPGFGPPVVGILDCGSRFWLACDSVERESPNCEPFKGEELIPICIDPGDPDIPDFCDASLPLWRGFSGECFLLPRPLDSDRSAAPLGGSLLSCGVVEDIVCSCADRYFDPDGSVMIRARGI